MSLQDAIDLIDSSEQLCLIVTVNENSNNRQEKRISFLFTRSFYFIFFLYFRTEKKNLLRKYKLFIVHTSYLNEINLFLYSLSFLLIFTFFFSPGSKTNIYIVKSQIGKAPSITQQRQEIMRSINKKNKNS
jgi:hypothetical protein